MTAPARLGEVVGGRYRLDRVVGAGAMGTVFEATHLALQGRFAVKIMKADAFRDPDLEARFMREARTVAALESVHAAKVYDIGRVPSGAPFLVMEFLEGTDLESVREHQKRLVPLDAVHWISQACEALAEAHWRGIVHRDLKLSNLFLARQREGIPIVKVLDFGLAKVRESNTVSLTDSTNIFGSPLYMSPEQTRSAKHVDARTDIWSLGVCLYELLTGVSPFDAPSVMEVCTRVLRDNPAPFADVLDEPALALVPIPLEAAVMRCLEKDPAQRWENIMELAASLEPFGGVRRA